MIPFVPLQISEDVGQGPLSSFVSPINNPSQYAKKSPLVVSRSLIARNNALPYTGLSQNEKLVLPPSKFPSWYVNADIRLGPFVTSELGGNWPGSSPVRKLKYRKENGCFRLVL